MKTLTVLAFTLTMALTAASASAANFQCSARGYDDNNFSQTVRGFMRPDMFSARDSAMQTCRMRRLTRCMVTFCHQYGKVE